MDLSRATPSFLEQRKHFLALEGVVSARTLESKSKRVQKNVRKNDLARQTHQADRLFARERSTTLI